MISRGRASWVVWNTIQSAGQLDQGKRTIIRHLLRDQMLPRAAPSGKRMTTGMLLVILLTGWPNHPEWEPNHGAECSIYRPVSEALA